jgi:hypothetical protein
MLTKTDLQQIRTVVKEEIKIEVEPLKVSVKSLDTKVDNLQKNLDSRIDKLDSKLDKAQEDISEILTEVIGGHAILEKRVSKLEAQMEI